MSSETSTVKVYELAKELGVDSISLLDKLKSLEIHVKSHMSELSSTDLERARASFQAPVTTTKEKSKAKPKTTATKTAVAKTAAAPKARKKAEPAATTTESFDASGEKKRSPILRRRTMADGVQETTITTFSTNDSAEPAANPYAAAGATAVDEVSDYYSESMVEETPHYEAPVEESIVSAPVEDIPETAPPPPVEMEPAPAPEPMTTAPETVAPQVAAAAPAAAALSMSTATAPAAPVITPAAIRPAGPAIISRSSTGPAIKPASPSIISKTTLLKRSNPAAPGSLLKVVEMPKITPRGAGGPIPSGRPSIGRPGMGRPGFPQQPEEPTKPNPRTQQKPGRVFVDFAAEEEKKKKGRPGERVEAEIKPEDLKFDDYKKKEMVFLPKRKKVPVGKEIKRTQLTTPKAAKRIVEVTGETIAIQDLAGQLGVKAVDVVRKLIGLGQMVTIHASIDIDTATLIATEYKFEVKNKTFDEAAVLDYEQVEESNFESRPPVVTIMGHVDHGKTSLLDAIREANVAGGEAGGITQHIGAYTVKHNDHFITFIDTPGHEAFSQMRARGANATDIVILVVAADDGVMTQTREAISHAKAAGVPIIVACNKMDKPGAQPDKVKQALAELDLLAEDWGGQTLFVPVSAVKKTGLDKLLESILLQTEIMDLKAPKEGRASGIVLEARLDKGRGPVVSVLVKKGTLRTGDAVLAGTSIGRVRALTDDKGVQTKALEPGFAAELLGFESLPNAGEVFDTAESEADARTIITHRMDIERNKNAVQTGGKVSLENLFAKMQMGSVKELKIILKADVFGSLEALKESLQKLSNDKIKVNIIHSAAGGVTESDVNLSKASEAIIVGFNVRPETKARQMAENESIQIRSYNIIYELIDDVKNAMRGLLDKKKVEKYLGRAEVRQVFTVPKLGLIAGSAVVDGKILRNGNARLLRDSRIVWEGKLISLRRFKDDAKEVAQGYECGIGLENYNDVKVGDLIEAYEIEMVTPELNI